ncbi:hypothetical protein Tco_1202053 [Tanacetum coccineum]
MKSSRKSTDMTANTPYYSRPIRRIQDFDESKDHCLTLKNTPYPHQRYAVYNTLVNDEELIGFTSIRRIHQEDTAYLCLHFTRNHEDIKTNTLYLESSIRRIHVLLYTKILEDIKRGPYSKKSPIRRIPHRFVWVDHEKSKPLPPVVGIKRLLDDLRVTSAKLMLLVQKLLLLVLKVNVAGMKITTTERLQLLEEFMLTEKRSKTYQR